VAGDGGSVSLLCLQLAADFVPNAAPDTSSDEPDPDSDSGDARPEVLGDCIMTWAIGRMNEIAKHVPLDAKKGAGREEIPPTKSCQYFDLRVQYDVGIGCSGGDAEC
jgi:hypothetical protein